MTYYLTKILATYLCALKISYMLSICGLYQNELIQLYYATCLKKPGPFSLANIATDAFVRNFQTKFHTSFPSLDALVKPYQQCQHCA